LTSHEYRKDQKSLQCQKCNSAFPTEIKLDFATATKGIIANRINSLKTKYVSLESLGWVFNKEGIAILKKYEKEQHLHWWGSMDGFAVMSMGIDIDPAKRPPKEFWIDPYLVYKAPAKSYTEEEEYSDKWNTIINERGYKNPSDIRNNAEKVFFAETEVEAHYIIRGLSI
jgi:hypothetical protein